MAELHTKRLEKAVRNYRQYKNSTVDEAISCVASEEYRFTRSGVFRALEGRINPKSLGLIQQEIS